MSLNRLDRNRDGVTEGLERPLVAVERRRRELLKTRRGLEIRSATGAEAPGLCELLSAAGHDISPHALAERLDAIRQGPGAALIAVEWGPPSGLVLLHWYRTLRADQPAAQITTLLVGPDERRRGIGRLLVKAAAQAARVAGCGALELLAAPEEQALRQFCRATGFTEAGSCFVRPLRKKG
jgi:GNAT superfamily N-acetyltransferase